MLLSCVWRFILGSFDFRRNSLLSDIGQSIVGDCTLLPFDLIEVIYGLLLIDFIHKSNTCVEDQSISKVFFDQYWRCLIIDF